MLTALGDRAQYRLKLGLRNKRRPRNQWQAVDEPAGPMAHVGELLAGEALGPLHQTPLHVAVDQGNVAMVEQLLHAAAPVGLLDFDKKTALHLALEMQVPGCWPKPCNLHHPIHWA